jgi:hypothetical protein
MRQETTDNLFDCAPFTKSPAQHPAATSTCLRRAKQRLRDKVAVLTKTCRAILPPRAPTSTAKRPRPEAETQNGLKTHDYMREIHAAVHARRQVRVSC